MQTTGVGGWANCGSWWLHATVVIQEHGINSLFWLEVSKLDVAHNVCKGTMCTQLEPILNKKKLNEDEHYTLSYTCVVSEEEDVC